MEDKLTAVMEQISTRLEKVEKNLSTFLTEFSQEAKLRDNDEVVKLKEQVAELSDPVKLRNKLMDIANTWTEDEYREVGEALGFPTTRALTPQEEAEMAEEDEPEPEPEKPKETPKQKLFIKFGNKKYEVL
jgi:hypothetical protein